MPAEPRVSAYRGSRNDEPEAISYLLDHQYAVFVKCMPI